MRDGVLVIGCGNPLRQDDGVGPRVAELLAAGPLPAGVEVLAVHQLTVELAEPLSRAGRALFIDCRCGGWPGSFALETVEAWARSGCLSHHLQPGTLLQAAREWYGHAPRSAVLAVAGAEFGSGEALSIEIEAALPAIVARARHLLTVWTQPGSPHSADQTG